jgi:Fe-S cluster assembly iron-binding protein IscA
LGLALDEPKDDDDGFEFDGLRFVVEKSLMEKAGDITIDYAESGWRAGLSITSKNSLRSAGGSSGCGSCCS